MQFIGDENISYRIMKILDIFDRYHEARHLTDYFPAGTPDITWIDEIGRWDTSPILISGDGAILRNKAELTQLRRSNFTYAVWSRQWMKLSFEEQVIKMLTIWPKLVSEASRIRHPSLFMLHAGKSKKIELRARITSL